MFGWIVGKGWLWGRRKMPSKKRIPSAIRNDVISFGETLDEEDAEFLKGIRSRSDLASNRIKLESIAYKANAKIVWPPSSHVFMIDNRYKEPDVWMIYLISYWMWMNGQEIRINDVMHFYEDEVAVSSHFNP